MDHPIKAASFANAQTESSVGRFFIQLADAVSKICHIAPLVLGIAVMGITFACFAILIAGTSPVPIALGICLVAGISLIVLTDYLPIFFKSIASRWIKIHVPHLEDIAVRDDMMIGNDYTPGKAA